MRLRGCAGPALWFGDEVLANRNEKSVAEAQAGDEEEPDNEVAGANPESATDVDAETAKKLQNDVARPAKKPEVRSGEAHPAVSTAFADGSAIPSKLDTEQRVTNGTALSKSPVEEPHGDPKIAAEIRAMGFDDPAEEAAALAAVQAAPAVHRAFLLRTMQASLMARQQGDDRANVAPRRLQPAPNIVPQRSAREENAEIAVADKPAPERRLERSMDESAVVAMEVERIDESEQVEPVADPILMREGKRHGVQKEALRNVVRDADDKGEVELRDDQEWQAYVDEAVVALEEHVGGTNEGKDPVDQARLRLLYLITGRRDEALAAIEGVSAAEKEFWSKELYALGALFDETQPDRTRRAALASEHLRQAADRLGEVGGLVVKSLHFCTEVKGYGTFSAFAKDEFRLGQEVLLYCEVENFQSTLTDRGHHTALKGRYQIFDASGNVVAEKDLSLKEEHCQNRRRDFFIPYFVWMPKQVPAGRYQLKLTIEDVHAQKVAESTIDFAMKEK